MRRILFLAICITLGTLFWFIMALTPPKDAATKTVIIKEGSGVNAISRQLKQENVIRNKLVFETLLWLQKAEGSIQAGTYEFDEQDSVVRVIERLRTGDLLARDAITFIEGWTLNEYRKKIAEHGYDVNEFDRLTASPAMWRENYWFAKDIPDGQSDDQSDDQSMEGYLFPDTYAIDPDRSVEQLITKMLDNFESKFTDAMRAKITAARPLHDVVTLASIVEKEVRESRDRRLVAGIFLTRIQAGMALQSDATIQYITQSGRDRSTTNDLAIDSPYNTYKYRGLPPGPIGNPSLDSLEAALMPEDSSYVYFLTDAAGNVHYASSFEEHQENRQRYLK